MSQWRKARVPDKIRSVFPNARMWQKDLDDGHLTVMVTIERAGPSAPWTRHLSISHDTDDLKPGRYPTWDEQREAIWRFLPGREMYSVMPPEYENYVNVHPTTFHWWEQT